MEPKDRSGLPAALVITFHANPLLAAIFYSHYEKSQAVTGGFLVMRRGCMRRIIRDGQNGIKALEFNSFSLCYTIGGIGCAPDGASVHNQIESIKRRHPLRVDGFTLF